VGGLIGWNRRFTPTPQASLTGGESCLCGVAKKRLASPGSENPPLRDAAHLCRLVSTSAVVSILGIQPDP
jgi:hypothetical protein